jgi:hypothetical protein
LISYISGNSKASIFTVDGCHDCIFIWVTRFGHIHESPQWDICTECKRMTQHVLCQDKGYSNNDDCTYVFIYKFSIGFYIISVYVDDLNIIGIEVDINEARGHLKDFGKTNFFLGLQMKHLPTGILAHQSAYVQKILEKFNMDKVYPSKFPMVVRALEKDTDPFRPHQEAEELWGSKYPYLSVMGALIYLTNNTRPDIAFAVNLLTRYNAAPTMHH